MKVLLTVVVVSILCIPVLSSFDSVYAEKGRSTTGIEQGPGSYQYYPHPFGSAFKDPSSGFDSSAP